MIWYFIKNNNPMGFPIAYVVFTLSYMAYYQFLIKKINAFNYDRNVIESLKKVYGYLRFYLIHYKIAIWLSGIMGVIYGFYAPQNQEAMQQVETREQWMYMIISVSIFMSLFAGALHFLVHLIYGRKIKRLKLIVKDFEKEG